MYEDYLLTLKSWASESCLGCRPGNQVQNQVAETISFKSTLAMQIELTDPRQTVALFRLKNVQGKIKLRLY